MRIIAEDTMALLIDYQERIIPVMCEREKIIHNTIKLIEGLKVLQIPTIVTQQYTKGLGMTIPIIKATFGEEYQYHDKLSFSCLDDQDINDELQCYQKKNIIVCGIEAHVCVLQTVIDLIEKGYNVILVEDCISSRKENDKKIALKRLKSEGAVISTYESILFEMTRIAGSDTFKEISKIVK